MKKGRIRDSDSKMKITYKQENKRISKKNKK